MMPESTNDHPESEFVDSETALGGADAVEKTTYVVGRGTSPEAEAAAGRPASVGRVGISPIVWVVVGLAVLVGIVYLLGIVRI